MAFTFFFRDNHTLEQLVKHLLPIVQGRSNIKIWDAGCAMGPEPYTLAILLAEKMGKFALRTFVSTPPTLTGVTSSGRSSARVPLRGRSGEGFPRKFSRSTSLPSRGMGRGTESASPFVRGFSSGVTTFSRWNPSIKGIAWSFARTFFFTSPPTRGPTSSGCSIGSWSQGDFWLWSKPRNCPRRFVTSSGR